MGKSNETKTDLKNLYNTRFSVVERIRKKELWDVLVKSYIQRFINRKDVVLDVGAGSCEFINAVSAKRKIALDLNPETKKAAEKNVDVISKSADNIGMLFKNQLDVVFLSNFLEHLENKEQVYKILKGIFAALKKDGRVIILQPDIKLVGNSYWDFFDHKTPITKKSIIEALESVGFEIVKVVYPFLPYTTDTKYAPKSKLLLKIYLRLRPLQLLFGKQFFLIAKK